MAQSLTQVYLHVIFATKHRRPLLANPDLRNRTHAYLVGICKNLESPAIQVGGTEDHVHLLCRFSKSLAISDFLRELKRDSSRWMNSQTDAPEDFHWQDGYGAFSISPGHVERLKVYIQNQEEHHRIESFQDEYRRICRLYSAPIDERYVWD